MTMTKDRAIQVLREMKNLTYVATDSRCSALDMAIESLSAETEWIPLSHDGGVRTNLFHAYDGEWVIVTDGNAISVERIRTYPYDHFVPEGRWFELEDVIAWMPLPKLYGERREP